ncbi:hypothetical protein Micbo1qcDRAFT_168504, partial [Microdochium bolleyi]
MGARYTQHTQDGWPSRTTPRPGDRGRACCWGVSFGTTTARSFGAPAPAPPTKSSTPTGHG